MTDSMGATVTYGSWNSALCSYFFNARKAGRPVYLQVDVETLQELAATMGIMPEHAEDKFRRMVRAEVLTHQSISFQWIEARTREWHHQHNEVIHPPPYIALLGLCVLAASMMHRDDSLSLAANDYYSHLNTLLGRDATGRPPDFDTIVTNFWSDLREWLNVIHGGRLGLATAVASSRSAYGKFIGYPISQCLLRGVDRDHLAEFFAYARIAPGAVLDPEDLVGPLSRWCKQSTCSLSSQAKRLILQDRADRLVQIATIIAGEAESWRGEMHDVTGKRSAPIVLRLDPQSGGYRFDLEFYPSRPPGYPSGPFDSTAGKFDLCPIEDSEWYEPIQVDVQRVLDGGLELRQGLFALHWVPKQTIVLRRDLQDLGAFVSVQQADLGEQAIILSREGVSLDRFLAQYAVVGWRAAPGTQGLPSGWRAYLNVLVKSNASSDMFPQFECLIPVPRTSIRLEGGLKLDATTWLVGAEPTLHVSHAEAGALAILIDGELVHNCSDATVELDLSNLGLPMGSHTITIDQRSRHFQTTYSGEYIAPRVASQGFAPLAYIFMRQGNQYNATYPSPRVTQSKLPPTGELWLTGTRITAREEDLPENLPQSVVLLGGAKRYILLGPRPGMICVYKDPTAPSFRRKHDKPNQRPFEFMPPFQVAWVVRISRKGRSVGLISSIEPVEDPTWEGGDVKAWAGWLTQSYRKPPGGEGAGLWQRYVHLARAMA